MRLIHFIRNKSETASHQDFMRIRQMLNEILIKQNHDVILHGDYYLGTILCLRRHFIIEIADLTEISEGLILQVRCPENNTVLHYPAIQKHISCSYVNDLIRLLDSYKQDDHLNFQLQLRPFGINYSFPARKRSAVNVPGSQ